MIFIRLNRSWVRFPQAAQIRPPGSGWAFLYALTGRAAWCARGRRPAREIATREPAARSDRSRGPPWPSRRPRAPQPGPGPSGALHTSGAWCAGVWLGASARSPARPSRRPRAPQPGPGPSGALHTGGAWSLMCGWVRRLEARPGPATAHGHRSRVLWTPNAVWLVVLGFWGAPLCVVTNVVNRRCFSCGFLPRFYKRRQSEGFFAENQGFWTQIDDVCNMSTRKGVQTVPV